MMRGGQDQNSKVFHELCGLVQTILRSPHLIPSSSSSTNGISTTTSSRRTTTISSSSNSTTTSISTAQVSPAGFASLLLGVSLALMLCGSVTFVIGFILMPWVLGLVMVLYFAGIISNLSGLGRAILYPVVTSPVYPVPPPSRKEISAKNYL
ncbi:hypothetical protein MKW94_020219 [Papaver nudicaule]|uniref:Transmembrane protein n=1 Tax=Papaver nudicaule TaxID=74823 RepID=A0AA42AU20_PAPNU|nr:hypothetical protein [Papaver nudicaule]